MGKANKFSGLKTFTKPIILLTTFFLAVSRPLNAYCLTYDEILLDIESPDLIVYDEYEVNVTAIFDFLTSEMNMNEAAACGVIANIRRESAFNPEALGDYRDGVPTSFGLCQWHQERYQRLITWCNDNGYDYKTVTGQMNYLEYELENFSKSTLYYLKRVPNNAEGAYLAAYNWCYTFERPSNPEYNSERSGIYARDLYWPRFAPKRSEQDLSWEDGWAWSEIKTTEIKPQEGPDLRIVGEEYTYRYFHYHNSYDGSNTMIDSIPYTGYWGMCEFCSDIKMVDERSFQDKGGRTTAFKGESTKCTKNGSQYWFEDIASVTYLYQEKVRTTDWSETISSSIRPQETQLLKIESEETYYRYFHYHNEYDGSNRMLDSIAAEGFFGYCEFLTTERLTKVQSFEDQGGRTQVRRGMADKCPIAGRDYWFEDEAFTVYHYRTREYLSQEDNDAKNAEELLDALSKYDYDGNTPIDNSAFDMDRDNIINLKDLLLLKKRISTYFESRCD